MYSLFDDPLVYPKLKELKEKWNFNSIIETGTCWAESALIFPDFVDEVYTCENNEGNFQISIENIIKAGYGLSVEKDSNKYTFRKDNKAIYLYFGNSPDCIRQILKENIKQPILFFLDAHWQEYQPLRDELKEIANANLSNGFILIHDFKTPLSGDNKTQFLYDDYGDIKLDIDYVQDRLLEINPNFKYFYNDKCEGCKRGILFVEF